MVDPVVIGKRLKSLRGNVSRSDVAKAIGVSLSALQMYENGARVPRDDVKVQLAQYYHTSVEAIFFT